MNPQDYAQLLFDVISDKKPQAQVLIFDNFKKILTRNKEIHLSNSILKELARIENEANTKTATYVSSASELSKEQKKKLEKILSKPIHFFVNNGLLGGIAIRKHDTVYNGTLRKRLETLRTVL